ncbi:PKD domain-containing protein [Parafilimonas sp.]|uniref:DUF7948 domain-containing protein n=1 Tax=Parafilimonas sp. TaxID=1969739 RepID=UPI0039E615F8
MKYQYRFVVIFFVLLSGHASAQYFQFVENKGQWDSSVKFKTDFQGGLLNLKPSGYRVVLHQQDQLKKVAAFYGAHATADSGTNMQAVKAKTLQQVKLHSHIYEINFLNANENAVAIPDKPTQLVNNYFIGKDSTKWHSGCKVYNAVTYKNVYKNVDIRYYSDNGNLKYDIIINPGADISQIAMQFKGLDGLSLNKYGNLTLKTSVGEVYQSIPQSYQVLDNLKTNVKVAFKPQGNTVRFNLGKYDEKATLIIDPTMIFSTFTGSLSDNWGYTATYDNSGDFFAGGIVFGDDYDARDVGGYDETFNGGDGSEGTYPYDIALIKFNSTGSQALFATYFGGSGDEQPHSLVCNSEGDLIMSGRTTSTDFPVTEETFGDGGSFDIFLAKFSADGSTLMASRKFGGTGSDGVNIRPKYIEPEEIDTTRRNYGDDARSEVIVDGSDNIYLASCTRSADFKTTDNAFKTTLGGTQDGVFIKTSSDLSNIYICTLLGGNRPDAAFVLAISGVTGNIYIAGGTASSSDMALNATNASSGIVYNSFQGGQVDGFVSMLSADGTSLLKTCYIGTSGNDMVYGVQVDKDGYPYIMGTTTTSFPVVNSAFNDNDNQASGKQFITKLSADLTSVVYSANFGKGGSIPDISPTAFLVDICGNVYVSGWGGNANYSYYGLNQTVTGLTITSNAIQTTTDGSDFYFFVLEKNAASQLFGSYFGLVDADAFGDHVDGGTSRFDKRGIIYQAVCANCGRVGTFPTTTGSWSTGNPAQTYSECNEAAVKIAFELSGIYSGVKSSINGVEGDTSGCIPLTVDFTDTLAMGKLYIWDFGDGSGDTTTDASVSHTYENVGLYTVMLVSIDSSSCNIADTSYVTIKAGNNEADVAFAVSKLQPCESFNYQFTNTSEAPSGYSFSSGAFTWDFGDGTVLQSDSLTVTHQYAASGTYSVILYLNDTAFCNSPDSAVYTLRVASVLSALFTAPSSGCAPLDVTFTNTSIGGQSFVWDFGDGDSSTEESPTHQYTTAGTYTVTLTATDSLTCNNTDDTSMIITVYASPTAAFTYTPTTATENTPYEFTNNSTDAVSYKWLYGDGDSLVTSSMLPVSHTYNASGQYEVCLIAYSENGCTDTACSTVTAIITPLVDVPKAFSPNGDGVNDIIYVQGFGISKMAWRIYNRWGQLMFTSSSISDGWNGRFKGALQPQDVYAYVLNIEFSDGTKVNKKGDITLLR